MISPGACGRWELASRNRCRACASRKPRHPVLVPSSFEELQEKTYPGENGRIAFTAKFNGQVEYRPAWKSLDGTDRRKSTGETDLQRSGKCRWARLFSGRDEDRIQWRSVNREPRRYQCDEGRWVRNPCNSILA